MLVHVKLEPPPQPLACPASIKETPSLLQVRTGAVTEAFPFHEQDGLQQSQSRVVLPLRIFDLNFISKMLVKGFRYNT